MAKSFQISELKKAIEGSGGVISTIAARLKCDWHTAKKYILEADLWHLVEAEDETSNDIAEKALMDKVREGDTTAIIFRLKTKAKKRGYVERQEIQHEGNKDNPVIFQLDDRFTQNS